MAAPHQSTPNHEGLFLESSEDFATHAYRALDLNMEPSRSSVAPSRHSRVDVPKAGRNSTAASVRAHVGHASAIENVLHACNTALSAEPSHDSIAQSSHQGTQHQSWSMQAADTTQYTNVLFQLRNSVDEAELRLAPSSVAAAVASIESENSALAVEISRTVAGSLCLPYEPHDPSESDPYSSSRGTGTPGRNSVSASTAAKPMSSSTARRSCKGLSWAHDPLAADNSWATEAREESMHNLLENDSDVSLSPPRAERSRASFAAAHNDSSNQGTVPAATQGTRQQRMISGRTKSMRRDWTRSETTVARVQSQQEATAVMHYNTRLQIMHQAFLARNLSRNSNLEAQMAALLHVPDRRSSEAHRGSLDEERCKVADPSVALAMATNPLMGILGAAKYIHQQPAHGRTCTDLGEQMKLPDGMCLLSPFCLLEAATTAANRPEKDSEDVSIPDVVLGMGTSHPFRRALIAVTLHWSFDTLMTVAIVVSCASMVFERPTMPEDSKMMQVLKTLNLVLTIIFGIEGTLKVVTYSPRSYWQSHSNKIDAFIVFISVLLMSFEDSGLEIFKALRCMSAA